MITKAWRGIDAPRLPLRSPRPARRLGTRNAATSSRSDLDLLIDAANTKLVEPVEVRKALERVRQAGGVDALPVPLEAVDGAWELVFSTAPPLEALHYIPVYELAVYNATELTTELRSELGPLEFAFKGSFTFDAASSSLAFSYSTLEISLFRLGPFVFDREPKPNVYEFYHCGDGILCAHSRGAGAETLLRKLPST